MQHHHEAIRGGFAEGFPSSIGAVAHTRRNMSAHIRHFGPWREAFRQTNLQ